MLTVEQRLAGAELLVAGLALAHEVARQVAALAVVGAQARQARDLALVDVCSQSEVGVTRIVCVVAARSEDSNVS